MGRCLHGFKVGAFDLAERAELVVVPSRIVQRRDVPVRPVVREDHSVLFHRPQDDPELVEKFGFSVLNVDFRRTRSPIGGALRLLVLPAWCVAG